MTRWKTRLPWMMILVGALLALLALLAVLQYRWTGQVSEAELDRLRARLRADASRFRDDFDAELVRIYRLFNVRIDLDREANPQELSIPMAEQYTQRFERWTTTAPYPKLVRDVLWVDRGPGRPRVWRFNRETEALEPAEWPAELESWGRRLQERSANRERRPGIPPFGPFPPIIEEIPALVIPVFQGRRPPGRPGGGPPSIPGFSVVRLDRSYIEGEFIPTLAARYFWGTDGLGEYDLAVISRDKSRRIIFQSNPTLLGTLQQGADVTVPFFALRPEAFRGATFEFPAGRGAGPGAFRRPNEFSPGAGPPPNQPAMAGAGSRGADGGRWMLVVRSHRGSLEAVVADARRRNLMISFTVLLLLAGSMSLIVVFTQRTERLARQQVEFVAGVSHDLRTPLAVICSAAENLADGVVGDRDQVRRYGTLIRDEGRRLTRMMEQVLEFAGIHSGKKLFELRPVQVAPLIDAAEAACRPQIEADRIRVEKEVDSNLPLVNADAAALTRSLQNLLMNAVKYGGQGGRVRIRARAADGSRGPEVQIKVEDRGSGIPPPDLPHIFEPFYRGRQAISARIHGSGLGLNLVKNIIEAHGGKVTVSSAPGQGSTFTLHLPVPDAAK